jgi:UDP-N-acetylglucosamine 4,6-dehydratase/UDP-glucose 4-epimerase
MKLVTGASGFLGRALVKRLMSEGETVRAFARNEGNLKKLKGCEIFPGDVSDACDVRAAIKGCDGIFHLAAFKHVTLAEESPRACIKTNVTGSMNICEQSIGKVKFVVSISTDKAVKVSGVYGASKLLMEEMFRQFDGITKFRVVRYGNVFYSTGSVLEIWKRQLTRGEDVTITNPEATRFYLSVDQAVDLIFDCLKNSPTAQPWTNEMKAISIGALLYAMKKKYDPEGRSKIITTSLDNSENLHEYITKDLCSLDAHRWTFEELYEIL